MDLNLIQLALVYNYHNVLVSKDVLVKKEINIILRHPPKSKLRSGWVIISCYEDKEYLEEKGNFESVRLGVLLNIDASILDLVEYFKYIFQTNIECQKINNGG